MVIAVVGSRDFKNLALVSAYVKALDPGTKVISGGARGVDTVAIQAAKKVGLEWQEYLADWNDLTQPDAILKTRPDGSKYDAKAGHRRNKILASLADKVVAFWDGESSGTMDTVKLAKKMRKLVAIIRS